MSSESPKRDGRKVAAVNLDHCEIDIGIGADQSGRQYALVRQLNLDLLCPFNDMIVGEDKSIGTDDNPEPSPSNCWALAFWSRPKSALKGRIIEQRMAIFFLCAGGDLHYGRQMPASRRVVTRNRATPLPGRWHLGDGRGSGRQSWQQRYVRCIATCSCEPFWPQRADGEQHCDTDRADLRENEP